MEHLVEESDIERIQIALVASPSHIPPDTIPKTKDAFHRFPQSWGWRLDDEFKLNILSGEETGKLAKFGVLLQAWLYFGLIFTIVQVNDKPILQYDDLCSGGYLSTKELKKKVEEWVDWEIQNPEGRWIRLIQAGYVLEKARHVVRQNCSCKLEIVGMEVDASEDGTNGGAEPAREELSAEPHGYFTRTGDARHLTDESALALMLVGECLWAAKSRIIQQCGGNLTGWHTDDDAGWGPPRYILSRMISARWCPRAVFLLKGQLRSSATLLLHAWSTYNGCPDRMVTWHTNCDRNICMARTTDDEGDYTNLCLHQDLNRHEPDQEVCDMVGPEMDEILEVLGSTDHSSRGDSDIPLIRFDCRDDEPIRFAVESLCRQNPQSFATISHVWSDGWGNEKINKLRTCQLRFIRRQLRRANGGKDIPFWMDTLIVPVRELQEGEEMDWDWREKKTKAIAQIFELFAKSSFTVILDNGLCSMPPGLQEKPADAAMKILASGWMRRLWTLHEAFLSKKRYVTFLETADEHNNLINLETLLEHLNTPAAQKSPLVSWVRGLLLQNIMDQEAKILADPEKRFAQRQAAMLVAGTWRAATWRVSAAYSTRQMVKEVSDMTCTRQQAMQHMKAWRWRPCST